MTKTFFKKITTAVLMFVLFYSVAIDPLVTQAQTAAVATAAQVDTIDNLSASLVVVGDQIINSPDITEAERLILMMSLVELSSRILALRKSSWYPVPTTTAAQDEGKLTAKAVKLTNVKVYYDYATNQASIVTKVNGVVATTTTSYPELPVIGNFENRMTALRKLASATVSADLNVKLSELEDILFVSARNPELDRAPITQNSPTANYLFEAMGQNTIANKVRVLPGKGGARIEIHTDQGEELWYTLTQELDSDGNPMPNGRYNYTYEYYVKTPFDMALNDRDGNPLGVPPKLTATQNGIPKADIEEFIVNLFDEVPFTSRIPNFNTKLISFLTDNGSYAVIDPGNTAPTNAQLDCIYASDKTVMNEFVKYLLDGIGAQYEDIGAITVYLASALPADSAASYSTACYKDRKF